MSNSLFSLRTVGLIIPALILILFGLIALFFINTGYFRNQIFFVIIAIIAYFIASRSNIWAIKFYLLPMYLISLFLLALVFFLGFESRGAVRWISLLGVSVQFSEILKPFLGVSLAFFLARCTSRSFFSFCALIVLLLPIVFLIAMQPDLGSALIYLFVVLFTLLVFGYPIWWFLAGLFLQALLFPIFWHFLHSYQQQRLLTFIHPSNDPLGSSYNAIQSVIAVGSGMFAGNGIGEGTQSTLRFLPERHTDFIFATLSEGLGFIGSVLIIATFLFLLYKVYKIFTSENEGFAKNLAIITFAILLFEFFINLGMNIGLLPVVGVPLPFVSYGGSAMLSNFILLGFLTSATNTAKTTHSLEIK